MKAFYSIMIAKNLETIDEKTAKSLFQRIAVWAGFDRCQIKAVSLPNNGISNFEMCFINTDRYVTSFLFKEDSRTGSLKNIYMMSSLGEPPSFKMFLHEILNCLAAGWHINFFNNGGKKTLLPAFSSLESLFVFSDLSSAAI